MSKVSNSAYSCRWAVTGVALNLCYIFSQPGYAIWIQTFIVSVSVHIWFLKQNFHTLSLSYVLIWVLWKPSLVHSLGEVARGRAKPVQLIQIQNVTADLSDEWIFLNCVCHTPLSKLYCLFYIVGSLLYFHVSCNYISSVFFSARFGCYIECEEIILWYEDQSFKTELVIAYKRNFSCESCIL